MLKSVETTRIGLAMSHRTEAHGAIQWRRDSTLQFGHVLKKHLVCIPNESKLEQYDARLSIVTYSKSPTIVVTLVAY